MTDQTIEAEIQAKGLTAPRVTPAQIEDLVMHVVFVYASHGTSTFCHAFLDGNFYLASGHSACVSAENFNAELGQKIALENVQKPMRDKLWELEGYALRSKLMRRSPIDRAVSRFLGWKLPDDFCPDCFVGFDPFMAKENRSWPTGTNLFSADQVRQMLEYVLADQ
ncbi:Gp49 family protein [Rhodoferax sp. BLA1]|uniref:Gp49 family protein n=1 Tax=Rhodoferax sp. BLA1 TaxID=2576062 RepID=UPI0015D21B6F|nr:Gp49 family protein [Rhodoferax sp. BLA1]